MRYRMHVCYMTQKSASSARRDIGWRREDASPNDRISLLWEYNLMRWFMVMNNYIKKIISGWNSKGQREIEWTDLLPHSASCLSPSRKDSKSPPKPATWRSYLFWRPLPHSNSKNNLPSPILCCRGPPLPPASTSTNLLLSSNPPRPPSRDSSSKASSKSSTWRNNSPW